MIYSVKADNMLLILDDLTKKKQNDEKKTREMINVWLLKWLAYGIITLVLFKFIGFWALLIVWGTSFIWGIVEGLNETRTKIQADQAKDEVKNDIQD